MLILCFGTGEVVIDNIFQRGERRFINKDMRLNFKKISAIATSALMVGMTAGIAAAANYPAPFVQNGVSNVAIVVGTGNGVSMLDGLAAININNDLHSRTTGGSSSGTSTSVSGGAAASLASGSDYLYLNDDLAENVPTLTKDDLPTVLADGTFTDDGGTDYDYEQTIAVGTNTTNDFAFGNSDNDLTNPALVH